MISDAARRCVQRADTIGSMRYVAIALALLVCGTAHADQALQERVRNDPRLMRLALSARICRLQDVRAETIGEIAKQRKYSAIGGVVDLNVMHTLQRRLRAVDEFTEADRAEFKHRKARPFGCRSNEVKAINMCIGDSELAVCVAEPMPTLREIIVEHDSDIPGWELFQEDSERDEHYAALFTVHADAGILKCS